MRIFKKQIDYLSWIPTLTAIFFISIGAVGGYELARHTQKPLVVCQPFHIENLK